jgi:molecular chaperone GrpE (heat shock protein)
MSTNPTAQKTEQKINEASAAAQTELAKVKAEFEEFKRRSQPKVQEAETFLTSPSAIGFYQGKFFIIFQSVDI